MDWSDPSAAVMSHGTAAVLRVLAGTDHPFGVRELARVAQISQTRARQAIDRLAKHGLIEIDPTAGAHLVKLNRRHLATEPAVALATLRGRVLERLRQEFSSWAVPALHVSLYGSAARGDGDTESDLDVLVVRDDSVTSEDWDAQVADSGMSIRDWTGNWVSWFQIDQDQLAQMRARSEPIVSEWLRDAVTLFGPSLPTLLRKIN
jgi:hypothetical protein